MSGGPWSSQDDRLEPTLVLLAVTTLVLAIIGLIHVAKSPPPRASIQAAAQSTKSAEDAAGESVEPFEEGFPREVDRQDSDRQDGDRKVSDDRDVQPDLRQDTRREFSNGNRHFAPRANFGQAPGAQAPDGTGDEHPDASFDLWGSDQLYSEEVDEVQSWDELDAPNVAGEMSEEWDEDEDDPDGWSVDEDGDAPDEWDESDDADTISTSDEADALHSSDSSNDLFEAVPDPPPPGRPANAREPEYEESEMLPFHH